MNKLNLKQKLKLIRTLLSESDYNEMDNLPEVRLLNQIFRISHPNKECPHNDWEQEAVETYKKMKKFINKVP